MQNRLKNPLPSRRRLYRLLRLTGSTRHKVRHVLDFLAAETLAADLESRTNDRFRLSTRLESLEATRSTLDSTVDVNVPCIGRQSACHISAV